MPHVAFVRAENAVGPGAESDASDAFTPHSPPCAPRGLTVAIAGDRSLVLTWVAPACDGGEAIDHYDLEGTSATCAPRSAAPEANARRHVFTDLVAGCEYSFTLTATTVVDESGPDDAGPIVVATLPRAPAIAGEPVPGDGEATIAWDALGSGAPSGHADLVSYRACPVPADAPCLDVGAQPTDGRPPGHRRHVRAGRLVRSRRRRLHADHRVLDPGRQRRSRAGRPAAPLLPRARSHERNALRRARLRDLVAPRSSRSP